MALRLVTPATVEPITLIEAKEHLRVDYTEEDNLIKAIISAARDYTEGFQRRSIAIQTWELSLDCFPEQEIRLPHPPLQSVISVKYRDKEGVIHTVNPADYIVNIDDEPGMIVPAYGKIWPSFTPHPTGAVKIQYTAGYTSENLPPKIRQAMLLLISAWYENREAFIVGKTVSEPPFAVKALLSMDRVW